MLRGGRITAAPGHLAARLLGPRLAPGGCAGGPGAAATPGDAAALVAGMRWLLFAVLGAITCCRWVWQTRRHESQKRLLILAGAVFLTSLFQQALRVAPLAIRLLKTWLKTGTHK